MQRMATLNTDGYLQYAYLLGECAPVILRALIKREEIYAGTPLVNSLQADEHDAQLAGRELVTWAIADCSKILFRFFGRYISRQERLEINFISSCRTEISARAPDSFKDDDVKRMTSDLILSLLNLTVQTDEVTLDAYEALLTEMRQMDRQTTLERIRQCPEYEAALKEKIVEYVASKDSGVTDGAAVSAATDNTKALRALKESLTKAALYGIDFSRQLVLDESIEIKGPEEGMVTRAKLVLLKVFNEVISGVTDAAGRGKVILGTGSLYRAVQSVVDLIQAMGGVRINEILYGGFTLRLKCRSVKQLKELLKSSGSSEFDSALAYIASLMLQEFGVSVEMKEKFLVSSIKVVKEELARLGVGWGSYKDLACTCGLDQPVVSFCDSHEVFCCYICAANTHSSCPGLNKTTENEAENLQVSDQREFLVRVEEDLDVCCINSCCILSNGDILLTDENNRSLKRLSKDGILSRTDLPRLPYDVSAIGPTTAAVGLANNGIQLVENKSSLALISVIDTDHPVFGIDSDGSTMYVTDGKCVYSYKTDGSERKVLYRSNDEGVQLSKLALSYDKRKIYIVDGLCGLETIDTEGNRLHSLRVDGLKISRGISLAKDGTVLVCEYEHNTVLRIDIDGKKVLGTILTAADGIRQPCALGFDKELCKLTVGMKEKGTVSVFDMK